MKYTPPRTDKKIRAIYCSLFILAVVGMVLKLGIYTTVAQCVSVAVLTASLALYIKYESVTFTYILAERDGALDFYIDKRTGRRGSYVCYFPVSDAVYLEKEDKNTGSALREKYKSVDFYKYGKNIFTGQKYVIVFENNGKYDAVIFEPDESFVALIRNEMDKHNGEENEQ